MLQATPLFKACQNFIPNLLRSMKNVHVILNHTPNQLKVVLYTYLFLWPVTESTKIYKYFVCEEYIVGPHLPKVKFLEFPFKK